MNPSGYAKVGPRGQDDSGSLSLAVLLTTVGLGLSVVLATIMAAQLRSTRVDVQRVEALNAATSGIAVTLSHIRSAVTSAGEGSRSLLPCGPLAGPLSGGSTASYTVTIHYLTGKPPSGDLAYAAANRLSCTPGLGPATMPNFALLESTGIGRANGPRRMLMATYTFQTLSNSNIAGGLIRAYGSSGAQQLCMAARTAPSAGGVQLVTRTCNGADPLQIFSYEKNLNLVLVSSRTPARPGGMCVDGGPTPTDLAPVRLQPCAATTVPSQQWGHNDFSAFQGTSNGTDLNNFCLIASVPGSASDIVLGDKTRHPATGAGAACDGDVYSAKKTFFPDATVGTGAAGPQTGQLVNNDQFGRCVDVTGNRVATPFLVVFPCKQSPDGMVLWNQKWTVPPIADGAAGSAGGPIYTDSTETRPDRGVSAGKSFCLTSPGSTAPYQYVVVTECTATTTAPSMMWTLRPDTGSLTSSYRIESTYGAPAGSAYCLTPTDPSAPSPDLWTGYGVNSKLVVAACSGDDLQKWNVPPSLLGGTLRDVVER
jgi:hypothetical protein